MKFSDVVLFGFFLNMFYDSLAFCIRSGTKLSFGSVLVVVPDYARKTKKNEKKKN